MREPKTADDPRICPICGKFLRNLKSEEKHFKNKKCDPPYPDIETEVFE